MYQPLTLRLEQERVIVSRDDGGSLLLSDPTLLKALKEAVSDSTLGATFAYRSLTASAAGMLAEAQSVKPVELRHSVPSTERYGKGRRIPLPRPMRQDSRPFSMILQERRSKRNFAGMPLECLATVLVRVGRITGWSESPDGYQVSYRPVPSAGARHPLELKVVACEVAGLDEGLWSFDAATCELVKSEVDESLLTRSVSSVRDAAAIDSGPAALLFLVAHFERTLSRYPNGASLVWRDAGVLAANLHLCATDLGLASRIVGTCGALLFDEFNAVADVCAVVIGG